MKLRDVKPIFYIYQIYKWIVYYPLIAIIIVLGLITVFGVAIKSKILPHMTASLWGRAYVYITPMFVDLIGEENIDPNQSCIMVANHQSQYDILLIYGWIPIEFKWVMKIELRQVPILGYVCYKLGHVYIDRSNHQKAMDSINEAKKRIKEGISIMFFPEGTRSNEGELLDFKKGAFKFALDIELPILPVSIGGTKEILPNNSTALFPGSAKLIIQKPIQIKGHSEERITELMDLAKKSIQKGINEHS